MVFVKHNSLKSDIFFNPMFIPGFSGSRFFRVQVFKVPVQGPGPGPGFGSRVRVQGPVQVIEVAGKNNHLKKNKRSYSNSNKKRMSKV